RQSRSNNIILFNLPEPTNAPETKPDIKQLKLIFNEMELNFEPIKYFRLGNPSIPIRPLKITFNDDKNVFDILRAQSKVCSSNAFKEIRFSSDRTTQQREQMSKLHQELETRRNNAYPLHSLFNQSLTTGVIPKSWKSVLISPIFKKGDRSSVLNFRPISKISIIPKLFTKIINSKLYPILNNILIDEQHGFRSGRSTTTNLAVFKQDISD
ncbi:Reverse transcriptase domain-containing protein, partial [Aphis craccivora]